MSVSITNTKGGAVTIATGNLQLAPGQVHITSNQHFLLYSTYDLNELVLLQQAGDIALAYVKDAGETTHPIFKMAGLP